MSVKDMGIAVDDKAIIVDSTLALSSSVAGSLD
jgi:hypothetical protein